MENSKDGKIINYVAIRLFWAGRKLFLPKQSEKYLQWQQLNSIGVLPIAPLAS